MFYLEEIVLGFQKQVKKIIFDAHTGSGKTLAYIWPLIQKISSQRKSLPKEGPLVLIVVPTRELSKQVFEDSRPYSVKKKLRVCSVCGGMNMYAQTKFISNGVEIVIGTPVAFH